jgi:hypothetical protein
VLAIVVALLPLRVAGALWLVLTVLALAGYVAWAVKLAVGRVSISLSAAVMGILLVSRPGFNLVELGQPTVVYLPLCWIVWRADSNRWTSAVALAFLLGKPPFAIPVLVFLLIQRSWVLLGRGLAIGAVVSAPILALLVRSEHGVSELVHAVSMNNSALARLDEGIAQRIDVTALVVRWTGSNDWWVYVVCAVMVLGLTGLAIRRRLAVDDYRVTAGSRNREAIVLAMALATLVSITHEDYDVLLLLVPIGAAWSACRKAVWPVVPAIAAVVLHTPARLPSVLTYERIAEFTAFLLLFALAVIDIQLARGGSVHKFEHALRRDDRSLNGPN